VSVEDHTTLPLRSHHLVNLTRHDGSVIKVRKSLVMAFEECAQHHYERPVVHIREHHKVGTVVLRELPDVGDAFARLTGLRDKAVLVNPAHVDMIVPPGRDIYTHFTGVTMYAEKNLSLPVKEDPDTVEQRLMAVPAPAVWR
jgi:hypothetical protein